MEVGEKMADTVHEIVSSMSKQDVYSALLGFLYELRSIPEYSLLSELSYLVKDSETLVKILSFFSGQTVKFPTEDELSECIQILRLYQYYEVEKRPWKDSVKLAGFDSSSGKLATNKLNKLKETIKKYNFGNRNY
jgi:hypothetical protein